MKKSKTVAVIGDGAWGTAVGLVLHSVGHRVRIWGVFPDMVEQVARERESSAYLPGVSIPRAVEYTPDPQAAVDGADLCVSAVPTQFIREVLTRFAPHLSGQPVLSLSKGIEQNSLHRPEEVLREVLGRRTPIVVLSGPSHAEEVARGIPTSVVAASRSPGICQDVQRLLSCETFRVYTSSDVTGVSLGGALKNVVAIAAGISDGLGFGDNTKAALITRGIREIQRLGVSLGGRASTFQGLSGMGDLIVTCASRHGRNRALGEEVGRGRKLSDILASTPKVAEGVWTSRAVNRIARDRGVDMPISTEVYRILFRGKDVRRAVVSLMTRSLKAE